MPRFVPLLWAELCSESLGDRLLHAQATIPGPAALKCGAKDKKCDTLTEHMRCALFFLFRAHNKRV